MNGATEHTLAELLRVAQEQNANMERLASLMSGRSGSGGSGGGGLGDMAKNIPLVSTAFSIAGAAVSAVGSVFEVLGNVVGKMVTGIGSAVKGLWSFSQKAMDGTAKMSDLFDAFGKLPFFIGEFFQIGAGLLRVLEKLTSEFVMMSKVGAGFTGGLTEMRQVAQGLGIGFADLAAMTGKNSQMLAESGLTVSGGFRKFVRGMDVLMGEGSQFRNSMFALGVSSKEAGEYMMTMMKLNQTQIRTGKMDAESLGRQTKEYIENLDQLTRLTGIHRDQVNEIIKKQADDATMENFLATLGKDEAADIRQLMALSTIKMGKEYTENVLRPQILGMAQGITGPVNAVGAEIAVATNGASVTMFANIKRVLESNVKDKGKMMFDALGGIALEGKKQADLLLKSGLSAADVLKIPNTILQFGTALATGAATAYETVEKEQKTAQERKAAAVELMAMQERMIRFGNSITLVLAKIAEDWGPTFVKIGLMLMGKLTEFVNWLGSKEVQQMWTKVIDFFDKVVLPKLGLIYDWFGETWRQLVAAWGNNGPKAIIEVLKDRLADGMNNIWKDMQAIWKVVSPGLIAIWDKDIKPVIISLWNTLLDSMLSSVNNAIKNWLYGPAIEDDKDREDLKGNAKRNEKDMGMLDYGKDLYLKANEALVGALSWTGLLADDAADRMYKQRVIDQNTDYWKKNPPQGRAGGGLVDPGTYLVGERGPELLELGASGNVTNNNDFNALLNKMAQAASANNATSASLEELNNTMRLLVRHAADTSDYARRTVGAIAQISGDIMPTI